MAYSKEDKDKLLSIIFDKILNGKPVRDVLKEEGMPDVTTFYRWIDEDVEKAKQYVRACEGRADAIFDEIIKIADDSERDFVEQTLTDDIKISSFNSEHVQRSRLRIDARKWIASKLNPKKFGDKTIIEGGDNPIKTQGTIDVSKLPTEVLEAIAKAEIKPIE